jgi:hypothetical protein
MCYTCGCKLPFESHGDSRNVIEDAFVGAGKTEQIKNAGRAQAKRNMLDLLREEERRGELDAPSKSYAEKS